jgi:hypothetical protein
MVRASEALPEETGSNRYAQPMSQVLSPDPTSRHARCARVRLNPGVSWAREAIVGTRKDSIEILLKRCDADIVKIEQEYNDSLHQQKVRTDLQVDIKNFCENLRSVLDYVAHDIRETYCTGADPKMRFYFPILASRGEFEAQAKKWYPGLDARVPDLWNYLETVQPYHQDYVWIGIFNKINNENKHGNLVAQTHTETEQVRVSMPGGGSVTWTPQNVKFGPGVFIGGVPVDPGTQMPVPHPSQKVERIIWVDFRFAGENVSALGLLKQALAGVRKIAKDMEKWI